LQSIEKMCIPDIELYIIELKGDHIKPAKENSPIEGKKDHNSIKNNKTLSLLNPDIKSALLGRGLRK